MLDGAVPWPPEVAARYRAEGYWRGDTLSTLLREVVAARPDHVAVVDAHRRWSYRELDAHVSRIAAGLRGLGLERGDRVVVQLPNVAEIVAVTHGLLRIGAIPVFVLPAHGVRELTHVCAQAEAVAVVVPDLHQGRDHRELARDVVADVASVRHVLVVGEPAQFLALDALCAPDAPDAPGRPDPCDPADVALMQLSGGTTGLPKLVPRTHDDLVCGLRGSARALGIDADTVYLVVLPAAHAMPLVAPGWLGVLVVGGTVVLATTPSPDEVFALIAREGVTATATVPTLARLWCDVLPLMPTDLTGLRSLQLGGEMVPDDLWARLGEVVGPACRQAFGMAEGFICLGRADDPPDLARHTHGRPITDADEVLVVDDADRPVAPGEPGELLVRGPTVVRGYHRRPDVNAVAFTPDGYFRTGDLVRHTTAGRLVVVGRVRDTINRGGEKIPAGEIESAIRSHPDVRSAAVVALPDAARGQSVCACVVTDGGALSRRELNDFLRTTAGLAAFTLPDRVEHLDELPLTAVGKVDKRRILADLAARAGAPDDQAVGT